MQRARKHEKCSQRDRYINKAIFPCSPRRRTVRLVCILLLSCGNHVISVSVMFFLVFIPEKLMFRLQGNVNILFDAMK